MTSPVVWGGGEGAAAERERERERNIFHMTPPRISAERQQLRGRAKGGKKEKEKKKKPSNFVALKGVKSSAPYSRRSNL